MTNRLAGENSPYLLQHKDNPVDWYPWGPEALAKARLEDKPIFLSIGYAACHWCHVMAHESFEDPDTAAFMNEHFVNIKVDREQRPDLDSIYMSAVVAMTGSGGWPMSMFLTPEGKPFYGGTYFPPVRRYNMPSFREVLTSIIQVWQEDRGKIIESSETITRHILETSSMTAKDEPLSSQALDQAALSLAQNYDWKNGGWGGAPKFPQPMSIEFLLRRAARGDKLALDVAVHALQSMAQGGMYDVIGGGFARYSTDDDWLVPHFEKMLYDNAQLALAYLHGYLVCHSLQAKSTAPAEALERTAHFFRSVCESTLDFVNREMTNHSSNGGEGGGFYSSLDADSEGEEGKFYLWTLDEMRKILTPSAPGGEASPASAEDFDFFVAAYDVTETGNFEGKTVLQRALDDSELAQRFNIPIAAVPSRLAWLHARLLEARNLRPRPGTDDKVLTSWNAMMLVAFAEAARYLKRDDYKRIAIRNAEFLLKELNGSGKLLRTWRAGKASHPAYLEDHAALILALLALYQTDTNPRWFNEARKVAVAMLAHYRDPQGGFFDTRDDGETLLSRPKDMQDNATPSGNAMAVMALLQLSAYTGNGEWRDLAEAALGKIQPLARRYPTGFAYWLSALDFALADVKEVAILGEQGDPAWQEMVDVIWSAYRPDLVAAISAYPATPGSPELLNDRPLMDGRPTAYVCRHFICQRPVTRVPDFKDLLGD